MKTTTKYDIVTGLYMFWALLGCVAFLALLGFVYSKGDLRFLLGFGITTVVYGVTYWLTTKLDEYYFPNLK